MQTKYYSDAVGKYLGGFAGAEPPEGAIEVPYPPDHADDTWNGDEWVAASGRKKNEIIIQIAQLEARQGRAVREAALGDASHLLEIENEIKALRSQL